MAHLLLNLRHVPDDEADDVRAFLDEARIAWYETPGGRWGFSVAGIWIRDDVDVARAKERMDTYQRERRERVRAEQEQALIDGSADTFARRLRESPIQVAVVLLAIAFMLGLVALPVWLLMR